MEETQTPMYSSDSFLPFPSATSSQESGQNSTYQYNKNSYPNSHVVPWKSCPYSCGVIGLHEEIIDFYEKMCPTEQEKEIRSRVVEHITKIVHSMWPYAKVQIFGSFRTGLYLPSSDIDMVIIGEWRSLPLQTLSEALQKNGISETDINVIARATVPIVRIKHTPSNVKVDISFNMKNGVEGALLIKKLIKEYPPLPKLVLVLKQFLVQRGLNEVYNGGMSSYCLTLLIVSLLQGCHKPKTSPSSNLGTLLLEFFEHYGVNFNYEKVSIHFESGGNYRPKFRADNLLCVEDPLMKGNDIAKGTFLMHALRQAFENAFLLLHKAVTDSAAQKRPMDSYLRLIVNIEEKLLDERKWLSQNYASILRKVSDLSSQVRGTYSIDNTSSENNRQGLKKKKQRIFPSIEYVNKNRKYGKRIKSVKPAALEIKTEKH